MDWRMRQVKRWKTWQIGLFVVLCILLNYGGSALARRQELPLWLDAFGTVMCAYVGGPFWGAVGGAASNLIIGMMTRMSHI